MSDLTLLQWAQATLNRIANGMRVEDVSGTPTWKAIARQHRAHASERVLEQLLHRAAWEARNPGKAK